MCPTAGLTVQPGALYALWPIGVREPRAVVVGNGKAGEVLPGLVLRATMHG